MRNILILISILLILYFINYYTDNYWCKNKSYNFKNVHFLTYGDNAYKKSREELINQANSLNFFNRIILETEEIENDREFKIALKNKEFNNLYSQKKGGGYWCWKPYIIYKNLEEIEDGDILFYSDSGSRFFPYCKSIKVLSNCISEVKSSITGILPFQTNHKEKCWTKSDTLDYFNMLHDDKSKNSGQFRAGMIVIQKCENSMNIINEWWNIMKNNPHLVDDSPSNIENSKEFSENRHDQSIFSLLCKKYNIKTGKMKPFKPLRLKDKKWYNLAL